MLFFECFLVEIFLSMSIFSFTIFGVSLTVFGRRFHNNYPLIMTSLCNVVIYILFCSLFLLFSFQMPNQILLSGLFVFDTLVFWGKAFLLIGTVCVLGLVKPLLKKNHINRFEVLILILSVVLGLIFLLSANDFLTLFLAVEMQSLGLYVLAASKKDSTFSIEAGLKYYLLGSLASTFFLFGVLLIYTAFGTTNFIGMSLLMPQDLRGFSETTPVFPAVFKNINETVFVSLFFFSFFFFF